MNTKKWYKTITSIRGPLVVLEKTRDVQYNEIALIRHKGKVVSAQVLETGEKHVIVQLFEQSTGLDKQAQVQFQGRPAMMSVGKDMLGRVFNGFGDPIDGSMYSGDDELDINGMPINPVSRKMPRNFIQTGISSIDCMATLVRGQKLPIFSAAGLPHNELASQIVRQATIPGEDFVVVFGAMGITSEEAQFFLDEFKNTGAMKRTVAFINLANDPSVERILTPRCALTTAEYLAFKHDMHVLVVLTDFTNYCEALREVSSARGEVPGRRGYPGYLYTDLANLYERAGVVCDSKGTVTQIPIISMPAGDITHPIPDLTGYITEGQIVLDNSLHKKGISPPINPLPSLSRLMNNGIGKGSTREDHSGVADQLYAAYAQGLELRQLVSVVGESALSDTDKKYLLFADRFEQEFLNQGDENRSIRNTLDKGWELLSILPLSELKKVKKEYLEKYLV